MSEPLQEVEKERAREREWAEKSEQIERLPLAVLPRRAAGIYEGTSEIQRLVLSRGILRELPEDPGGIQGS